MVLDGDPIACWKKRGPLGECMIYYLSSVYRLNGPLFVLEVLISVPLPMEEQEC
jgi:hypothetical protein